jgi:RHS repeat-associated protein
VWGADEITVSAPCGRVDLEALKRPRSRHGYLISQPSYNNPSNNKYLTGWNGASYDASGNLLNDTFNTYTWDAYGNLATTQTGRTITYDAFNRMAEITSPVVEFVYAPGGQHPLASMNGQNLGAVYVPLPGGAFAIYNGSGVYQYNHPDFLGSAKLFSTPTRTAAAAMAYAPFGEGYAGGQQWEQFTTWGDAFTMYYNEGQTGTLDDFTFRRYSPVQGRWISPDPAGLGAVNPANPQSWNRYAYVGNAPLTSVDPLGLWGSDVFGSAKRGGYTYSDLSLLSFLSSALGATPDYKWINSEVDTSLTTVADDGSIMNIGGGATAGGYWSLSGYTFQGGGGGLGSVDPTNSGIIGEFSALRFWQNRKELALWYTAKAIGIYGAKKWGQAVGADLSGLAQLLRVGTGLGILVMAGSTMIDATSPGMPLAPGPPTPPDPCMGFNWVPGPNGTTVGVPACQ